jgi:mRNA-degrading endonuclease RelE of RelBE toxin-antitoxin system
MEFDVRFVPSADDDLDHYRGGEQKLILDGIVRFLGTDADVTTRRKKQLRPNPVAPWELRLGAYRVFYELREPRRVRVLAVGHKVHNDLFIRGRKVTI